MKNVIFALACSSLLISPSIAIAQNQSPCSGSVSITDTSQAQPGVLIVVSNSAQASFNISGPARYSGSGYYWVKQGIPSGTYTVTWNAVASCGVPSSETKSTGPNGSVAFAGNYKYLDTPVSYGTTTIKTNLNTPADVQYPTTESKPQTSIAPTTSPSSNTVKPQGFFARLWRSVLSILFK